MSSRETEEDEAMTPGTPGLPPGDPAGDAPGEEDPAEASYSGEMDLVPSTSSGLSGNVIVDSSPLQNQMQRNKECKKRT